MTPLSSSTITFLALTNKISAILDTNFIQDFYDNLYKNDSARAYFGDYAPPKEEFGKVFQYGCWCNFQETPYLQRGFGEPVDEYDANCKQLEENYICAYEETFSEGDKDCSPWEANWVENWGNQYGLDTIERIQSDCATSNAGDNCKIRSCMIELYYLYVPLFDIINSPKDEFMWENGFDRHASCVKTEITQPVTTTIATTTTKEKTTTTKATTTPTTKESSTEATSISTNRPTSTIPITTPRPTAATTKVTTDTSTVSQAAQSTAQSTEADSSLTTRPSTDQTISKYYKSDDYSGSIGPHTDTSGNSIEPLSANIFFGEYERSNDKFQYGCWCNFKEKPYMYRGHGEPVDVYDAACKQLEENYICAQAEFDLSTCDITSVSYSGKDILDYYSNYRGCSIKSQNLYSNG